MTDNELLSLAEQGISPCFCCGRRVPPTRTTDGCHSSCKFYKVYRAVKDALNDENLNRYFSPSTKEYVQRLKNAGARERNKKND